ncbi:hypothetical protein ACROYT_G013341 [Oculina patagonica]
MEKQRSCFRGGKRSVRHLPTISEEVDDAALQKRLVNTEENREEIIQLKKSSDKSSHSSIQNKRDMDFQQTLERKTVLFRHMDETSFTEDRCPLFEHQLRTTKLLFQTGKQRHMNEAKVLFPDFFPQAALQETCEDSSWKARPTMEQIFSGQNNTDFLVSCGLHHNTNFEYWKRYQLSF